MSDDLIPISAAGTADTRAQLACGACAGQVFYRPTYNPAGWFHKAHLTTSCIRCGKRTDLTPGTVRFVEHQTDYASYHIFEVY